jgi:hypothetical protein
VNLLRKLISKQHKRIAELSESLESLHNETTEFPQYRLEHQELQSLVKSQQNDIMNLQVLRD